MLVQEVLTFNRHRADPGNTCFEKDPGVVALGTLALEQTALYAWTEVTRLPSGSGPSDQQHFTRVES